MTQSIEAFLEYTMLKPLDKYIALNKVRFYSKASESIVEIESEDIMKVVANANKYLVGLSKFFKDVDFDFYSSLGQRNISGFVGEIFVKSFEKSIEGFKFNPHGDGRPDILDISTDEAKEYLHTEGYVTTKDGISPSKANLTPFKFGGLEVKASIGNPVTNYRQRLMNDKKVAGFDVGLNRLDYLSSITYWGHHTSCENLIGIYYDYSDDAEGTPQIFAVMHSELIPKSDWNKVSIGKVGSKKTSNTSLTTSGRTKLYNNVITVVDDKRYLDKLRSIGLKV